MNQIPNIEETHNTREIEELKKEFIAEYKAGHKEGGMRSYLFTGQNGSLIADWWIEKLHQQLQKAREEERVRAVEIIKDELRTAPIEVQMTKGIVFANIINQIRSELDQDKK